MFSNSEQKKLAYRMQVFAEVVKQGSFSAAAESMGHTKSAISNYITQLEKLLDCRLLNRTTRRLKLTPTGELFAQRSQELVLLLKQALSEIQYQQKNPTGHLRLTAPATLGEHILIPCLQQWRLTFPGYQLNLQLNDQRLDLMKHDFDLALRVGELESSSYKQIYLGKLKSCLVVQTKLYQASALEQIDKITLPWQPDELIVNSSDNQSIRFVSANSIRLNTVSSAISAVVHGIGMAVLPTLFVQDKVANGEILIISEQQPQLNRPIYLLHAYNNQLPPALRYLAEQLKTRIHSLTG